MEGFTLDFSSVYTTPFTLHFKTVQELQQFVGQEQKAWNWLWQAPVSDRTPVNRFQETLGSLQRLANALAQTTPDDSEQKVARLNQIKTAANQAQYFVDSQSPEGQELQKIHSEHGQKAAAAAFITYTQKSGVGDWLDHQRGFYLGNLLRNGQLAPNKDQLKRYHEAISDVHQHIDDAGRLIDELQSNYQLQSEKFDKRYEDITKKFHAQIERNEDQIAALFVETRGRQADLVEEHEQLLQDRKNRIDSYENALRLRLNTEAARDYWEEEARHHGVRMWVWFGIFVGAVAMLLLTILRNLDLEIKTIKAITEIGTPALILISFTLVLIFWLLKVFSSNWRLHSHKHQDARERMTLIDTYIALMAHEDSPIRPEDRHLILPTLFRPGSDGLVSEDGIPSPWLDMISKLMPKK